VRGHELAKKHSGYHELELERTSGLQGVGYERRFVYRTSAGAQIAQWELYRVRGRTALRISKSIPADLADERGDQLDQIAAGIAVDRAGILRRLRQQLQRQIGKGRARGSLRARLPAGWERRESLTVGARSARANLIASMEPIDPGLGTEEYGRIQSQLLIEEFPEYVESEFRPAEIFSGRQGHVRAFSWHPEDTPPVAQWQAYYAEAGRGYTGTATCLLKDQARLERRLRNLLANVDAKASDRLTE
jgi:hypothetical protein